MRKLSPQPDGSTLTQLSIDLSRVPAPERSYSAERAGVGLSRNTVHWMFGQDRLDGQGFRSLIVVAMPPESVVAFLKTAEAFPAGLQAFIERNNFAPESLIERPQTEPPHVVELRANLTAASYSGREAELQFFHLAPLTMHRIQIHDTEATVDPVVRVGLSSPLLNSLVIKLLEVAKDFPGEIK